MDRRTFLKTLGAGIVGLSLTPSGVMAKMADGRVEFMGVLVDTTRCIGCRSCELACAEANGLPLPDIEDDSVFEHERRTTVTQWTVVNRYETEKGEVFVKKQCMHCCQPACVAACPVKAMQKRPYGPVTWDLNCIGCKTCIFSCVYDIPHLEIEKPAPKIQKCIFCWERLKEGKLPACVEACPQEALIFGTRRELLEEARTRIYEHPDRYVHHIYGEREIGGTCWLYLSSVPFDQIGFRTDLESTALPEHTTGFLYAVPFILVLWPAILLGMYNTTKREEE
ncbi:MAG: 4Fe-4S dicluster domain-containing protein [Deltaproteobacteria bacterium]|nr:MAG: 4Fe-4S dicluster domain-containing protein [Deltaproteobacteria bacterium]